MTPDQVRAALADLGLSQVGFARIALVDARTVRRWCDGTRAVPGPVVALLGIQAASKAAGGGWVTLRPQVRDAWGYGTEWWRVNTGKLVQAGFIEVERRSGAVPRYRLVEKSACQEAL